MSRTRFRSDPTTRRGSRAGDEETSRANVVEGTRASMDFIRARANARDDERVVARAGRGRRPRAGGVGGQRPRRRGSIRRRDRLDRYRLDRSIPIRSIDTDSIDRYRFDRSIPIRSTRCNRIDIRFGCRIRGGVGAFSRALWGASAEGVTDEAARVSRTGERLILFDFSDRSRCVSIVVDTRADEARGGDTGAGDGARTRGGGDGDDGGDDGGGGGAC